MWINFNAKNKEKLINRIYPQKYLYLGGFQMKMCTKKNKKSKESVNNVPNAIAYKFIRGFINSGDFEEVTQSLFIKKLNKQQTNQVMNEIKWLFKNYPDLEVMTIQDNKGKITKFIL